MFDEAYFNDLIVGNPAEKVDRYGETPEIRDVFTRAELHKLFLVPAEVASAISGGHMEHTVFYLLADHGSGRNPLCVTIARSPRWVRRQEEQGLLLHRSDHEKHLNLTATVTTGSAPGKDD